MDAALQTAFAALPPMAKVTLLTRLVHAETLRARDLADNAALRASNALVHGIAAYISAILDGRHSGEQDVAILQTLSTGAPHLLAQLGDQLEAQSSV